MGLDVTAVHLIWFFAILGASMGAVSVFYATGETAVEAGEVRRVLEAERLHARLSDGWFCHDDASDALRVNATNAGRVPFSLRNVTFLVDGAVAADGWTAEAEGAVGSDLWPPGEEATFRRSGQASEPDRVVVVTERGVAHYPEKRGACVVLTTVTLTPASASMQIGDAQTFTAAGFDQNGDPYPVPGFTWSDGGAGALVVLDATTARLTAGTTAGTFSLTASYAGVTGTATVTIHPGAPASLAVTPDPVDVQAGGTQTFTATAYDAYGNVNATPTVTWTTNAGAITSGGVLTAQTTTATGLGVTATSGSLADTATVNVVPGPVDRVVLSPTSATVVVGRTQAFTATAYDAYNNVVTGATITWSATRGAVDAGGLYTAPSTTGADTVTATAGGKSASATVSVIRQVHVDAMGTYLSGVATSTFEKRQTVETRVTVRDQDGTLVQGVTVTIQIVNPSGTVADTLTGTTSASGVASISWSIPANAPQGTWTDRVSNLSGTDLQYDSAANLVTQVTFTVRP